MHKNVYVRLFAMHVIITMITLSRCLAADFVNGQTNLQQRLVSVPKTKGCWKLEQR